MASQDFSIAGTEKGQRLAKATYPTYVRNRLPTLQEVLTRKTAPPVCLYNFYLYMRDREFASEYLDFYLDVLEHEVICKAYVKDLKKLGKDVSTEYPEFERFRPGGLASEKYGLSRQSVSTNNDGVHRQLSNSSHGSNNTTTTGSGVYEPSSRPVSPFASNAQHIVDIPSGGKGGIRNPGNRDSVRSSKTNNTAGNLSFYDRERPFTREDLRESAERIYFKYIYRGSEKEIELSDHIREKITHAIEEGSDTQYKRDDPWIYHEAKREIFSRMEKEYFPGFLRARAFGNMNVYQAMLRLAIGLFFLFIGFAVALSLIFLNVEPHAKRIWSFIPIFLGVSNLFAHQTEISPLFVALGISEIEFFKFQKVREIYIYKLHKRKGLKVFLESLMVSIIITVIFTVVPGHRL